MFSAISARNLRQMTVTLVPNDGDEKRFPPSSIARRIPLDGDMRWHRSRLLTMPRPAMLQWLADVLAGSEWVAVQRPGPASDEAVGANAGEVAQDAEDSENQSTSNEYYRMKRDVANDSPTRPLSLREVRVEIWEYRLNSESNRLELTRLAGASSYPN